MTPATVPPSPDLIPRYCAWLESPRYSAQSIQGWRYTAIRIMRAFPAGLQVQQEIRTATGLADLPVFDVMVKSGAWVILPDRQPSAVPKGVA